MSPCHRLQLVNCYVVSQDMSSRVVSVVKVNGQVIHSYGQSQTSDDESNKPRCDKERKHSCRIHTELARRTFSVAAPSTWNSLPADIRLCENILTFKRHLKTHLFKLT